jgi:predicted metal-dependent hydrolase
MPGFSLSRGRGPSYQGRVTLALLLPPGAASVSTTLELASGSVPLDVRRSPRARRLYLRVDPAEARVELVLPRGVGVAEGMRFARARADWVESRLAAIPETKHFADGAAIPFLGRDLVVRHRPDARHPTRREGDELLVTGQLEHLPRRVRDWLKAQARIELTQRSQVQAARIGRTVASVRLGDPRSRWGSCSAKARLAYSWRLVLAPPGVLDYVVAHEVAHLCELNHSRRFWRLVASLVGDVDGPRRWLAQNGAALLRIG